jgi:hypothetical protein
MRKQYIKRPVVLTWAVLALSLAPNPARAQAREVKLTRQASQKITVQGPSVRVVVRGRLSRRELRRLIRNARTAQDHPLLAEYYRSQAHRLRAESKRYEQLARAFGDAIPLIAPNHYNVSRTARHCHVIAKGCFAQAQGFDLLAAAEDQAAQRLDRRSH